MTPQPPAGPPQPPPQGPQPPAQQPPGQSQPDQQEAEYVPVQNWTPEPVFDSADYLDREVPTYLDEGTEETAGEPEEGPPDADADKEKT